MPRVNGRLKRSTGFTWPLVRSYPIYGGLAQLGERLAGSQKVIGSSPLSSTRGVIIAPQAPSFSGITGLRVFLVSLIDQNVRWVSRFLGQLSRPGNWAVGSLVPRTSTCFGQALG